MTGTARTPATAWTPTQDPPGITDARARSREELLAEVRRLQIRAKRQDVALGHATDAIVTLRRGVDALHAHNRELLLEANTLRAVREGARARA